MNYGYQVGKISMKEQTVVFRKLNGEFLMYKSAFAEVKNDDK